MLVEGNLFRQSNVVSDIVNWRYGVLFDHGPFVTFRQAPPDGAAASTDGDMTRPQPTKVAQWHLAFDKHVYKRNAYSGTSCVCMSSLCQHVQ